MGGSLELYCLTSCQHEHEQILIFIIILLQTFSGDGENYGAQTIVK